MRHLDIVYLNDDSENQRATNSLKRELPHATIINMVSDTIPPPISLKTYGPRFKTVHFVALGMLVFLFSMQSLELTETQWRTRHKKAQSNN